jgi:hypothetical protein
MRSFSEYKGMEISGRAVFGIVRAFGQFKALASQLLLAEGIGQQGMDGLVLVQPEAWYPLDAYLRAYTRAGEQMNDSVLHQLGVSVAKIAEEPVPIKDLRTAARALDQGYHLAHRKNGRLMWDPATGQTIEGIGHFQYRERADGAIEIESDTPYPCASEKGILFGLMQRIHAVGAILHDESHPCRNRGKKSCLYVIKA